MRVTLRLAAAMVPLALLGCANTGVDRLLTVSATGTVRIALAFDYNGDRLIQPGVDSPLVGVRVKLVTTGARDSVAGAVSQASGLLTMSNVPVGTYLVVVDTTPLSDTAVIAKLDSTMITVHPADTVGFNIVASYPHLSVAQARSAAVPLGHKVFLDVVALNALATFADTTVHVTDTSGAIRAARVLPGSFIAQGDTLRLRGTMGVRTGQRVLDLVTVFALGTTLLPPATTLSAFTAAGAQGGTRDAQAVHIDSAIVSDTVRVHDANGNFFWRMTVTDASGPLDILLDGHADATWADTTSALSRIPPNDTTAYVPGHSFRVSGVLVPSGTPGLWLLRPRSSAEVLKLR